MANLKFYEGQEFDNPSDPSAPVLVYRQGKLIQKDADLRGMSDLLKAPEQTALNDAREAGTNAIQVMRQLTNFQNTNEGRGTKRQETGGLFGGVMNKAAAVFGDPEAQYLDSITSSLAPQQRIPGSGTTSDRDLALFLKATPGLDKNQATNTELIETARAEAIRRQQRADFLDQYARKYGTLNGSEEAFRGQVGKGWKTSPYSAQEAGDRATLPRGAYYRDPQGNLRRNDNGPTGNPVIEAARVQSLINSAKKPAAASGGLTAAEQAELAQLRKKYGR